MMFIAVIIFIVLTWLWIRDTYKPSLDETDEGEWIVWYTDKNGKRQFRYLNRI
jgi:hypothetical protein